MRASALRYSVALSIIFLSFTVFQNDVHSQTKPSKGMALAAYKDLAKAQDFRVRLGATYQCQRVAPGEATGALVLDQQEDGSWPVSVATTAKCYQRGNSRNVATLSGDIQFFLSQDAFNGWGTKLHKFNLRRGPFVTQIDGFITRDEIVGKWYRDGRFELYDFKQNGTFLYYSSKNMPPTTGKWSFKGDHITWLFDNSPKNVPPTKLRVGRRLGENKRDMKLQWESKGGSGFIMRRNNNGPLNTQMVPGKWVLKHHRRNVRGDIISTKETWIEIAADGTWKDVENSGTWTNEDYVVSFIDQNGDISYWYIAYANSQSMLRLRPHTSNPRLYMDKYERVDTPTTSVESNADQEAREEEQRKRQEAREKKLAEMKREGEATGIYSIADKMPHLIGGLGSIQSKIVYPDQAKATEIEGRVFVQFIVNEQGEVENPVVVRGIGAGCDEEAVRVMRLAKFNPGVHEGEEVKVKMSLPITFKLK